MKYPIILLDIDGTLINFSETYNAAIAETLAYGGHDSDCESIKQYYVYNDDTWFGLNLDNVDDPYICKNYHPLYHKYLLDSNESARAQMGLNKSSEELTECFINALGKNASPNANTVEVCKKLSATHTLCIASNGLTALQMSKLTAFNPYISHYFISEDLDCIKPESKYFQCILHKLQCRPSDCIMVGDSLKNDISGANKSGIASCYYNPFGQNNSTGIIPTYEIRDFAELLNIV